MKDLMGAVLAEIRAWPGVAAIAADRVSSAETATNDELTTRVVLRDLGGGPEPYGAGSGRLGMQDVIYAAQCYGPKDAKTGPVTARQLVGAVTDALHDKGPRRGSSGRGIYRSEVLSISGLLTDPGTQEPFYTATVHVVGMAQATP